MSDEPATPTAEDLVVELLDLVGARTVVVHGPHEQESEAGRDVDCLVDGIDPYWPLRLSDGWTLLQWTRYDLRAWYWVLRHGADFVALDTTDDPEGLCRDAVRTRSFLAAMESGRSPALHAAYLTVKRVRKRSFDPVGWASIGELAAADRASFADALELAAGKDFADLVAPVALLGTAPSPAVERRANRIRWIRRFGSPARAIHALVLGARRYAERIGNPAGLSVLLVGPDGAGKSTVAYRLATSCAPMFRRTVQSHWRPGILPRPGAILRREAGDPTVPHARPPFGRIPSVLLLGYYWADFMLGAAVRDLPTKIRSGLVLRERGWWDLQVDPRRYRLDVAPSLVRALGALLPGPDLVVVLEGPADLLRSRKPELEVAELERQLDAWRSATPVGVPTVRIPVSSSTEAVVHAATEAVEGLMEARAVSRLGSGWAALPGPRTRWWLPRGTRSTARAAVSVYQPVTGRALLGWTVARALAGAGGFRWLPRGSAPPATVRRALSPHIPPGGTIAVGRATHPGRFIALVLDQAGRRHAVAKVATDPEGARALEAEGAALRRFGGMLPSPLAAPRVLDAERGVLLLEQADWRPRARPWVLDEEVARALGELFRAGSRDDGEGPVGPAHGDCAPWNLLRTDREWVLVDWESAAERPAFHDVCHHVVQTYALLGRPSASEVVAGFTEGRGWIGRAVQAYAAGAGVPAGSAPASLVRYLRDRVGEGTARTAGERRGLERRRRLLDLLSG